MNPVSLAEDAVAIAVPQTRLVKPIAIGVLALIAAALVAFLAWWIIIRPRQAQVAAAAAKVEAATGQATAAAAQDAVKIVTVHDREVERIHTITEGGAHAVQTAADAGTQVPAVGAAMRRSLCLYDTYRADPGCAALPGTGEGVGTAGADTGSGPADR